MVENIDARNGPTQFALGLAAKDAGLIVETGRALGVPTPVGAAVMQVLVGAIAAGLGDHDWADLVVAAERQGNVELHWKS
jgi:3-hydroxyisobutyrate dehydrogenase-like beta-hydroxyacid dehydrogenase